MVHCIHNNQNQKKDYLDVDVSESLQKEMMLLSTKDEENTTNRQPIAKLPDNQTSIENNKELKSEAFSVLNYEQVKRLHNVMEQIVPIHGKVGSFPTLDVKLKDLVKVVRTKLEVEQSIKINEIRLNGGCASSVLCDNSSYNDIDLIFSVDLTDPIMYEEIRTGVLNSLLDFLPESANTKKISQTSLKEAYIHKMVKVNDKDKWSLFSLSNNLGRNVELKFVHKMKRQFEFSVDSFHIILDSLMLFYECSEMPMNENIYPNVIAESVYGNFNEALSHLENKKIVTQKVEEIRGGGLLKYCNLLIRDYTPIKPEETKTLERYMCSRFFIDFSELPAQKAKLESYLHNHFIGDDYTKTRYLLQLYNVVNNSTVCLMSHERRQTLNLIQDLGYHFYLRHQQQNSQQPTHHYPHFPHYSNSKQNQTQFFPHIHHLIRPHHAHPYDVIVATNQQQTNKSNQTTSNSKANTSNGNSNSTTNTAISTNSSSNQLNNANQQSNHHSNNHNLNNSNCKNNKQQQYHAYLFGGNANLNSFYYSPYHHYHHNHTGCFNCTCVGGYIGCLSA